MQDENHDKRAIYNHNNSLQIVLSFNKLHPVKKKKNKKIQLYTFITNLLLEKLISTLPNKRTVLPVFGYWVLQAHFQWS